jgi:hypothetical protein
MHRVRLRIDLGVGTDLILDATLAPMRGSSTRSYPDGKRKLGTLLTYN